VQNLNRAEKLELVELLEERNRRESKTVLGIVHPVDGHTHSITLYQDNWIVTQKEPDLFIPAKLEKVATSRKRFIVIIGGRGSGKSVGVADITLIDSIDTGAKTYCLREYQSSIKNSVHSLLKDEIKRLELPGFDTQQNTILFNGEDAFQFAGLARNVDSIKSAHGFKRYAVEEAQFISEDSLTALTPTARKKPKKGMPTELEEVTDTDNVSMIFIANPQSSADPFSQRFINPFKGELDKNGFYEDDLHLIVVMNYQDNPWYKQSGLEDERVWDWRNRSRAMYDHIWDGAFNDDVEDAIIKAEWFDAAVDAHKLEHLKELFKPHGAKVAAHDCSDTGKDAKSYVLRHGSIIQKVKEKTDGEIDEGCDWATGNAIEDNVGLFVWDGDGMGAGLKRQVSDAFAGTNISYQMFRGSLSGSAQDNAEKIYMPVNDSFSKTKQPYKETFKNNRAQYYIDLADRYYNTYKCVVKGQYIDPDLMISIDSEGVENMTAFRSETCRIPRKNNPSGLRQIMSKDDMKRIGIKSPNLTDGSMMCLVNPVITEKNKPLPKGRRRHRA